MPRIRYKNDGEKCFALGEEFLVKSFIKRRSKFEPTFDEQSIKELRLFKGMLMTVDINLGMFIFKNYLICECV